MSNTNEHRFRIRLIELLRNGEFANALSELSQRRINEEWCDEAVAAYVRCGENLKAREIINWSKANARDIAAYRRCLVEYASGILKNQIESAEPKQLFFGNATPENRQIFEEVISILSPVIDHIKANDRVANPLELKALRQNIIATIALGDAGALNILGSLLRKYEIIPLDYVKLVLAGLLPVINAENIFSRICSEHNDSFEAEVLKLTVESELCGRAKAAFENGKKLLSQLTIVSQKRDICGMLFQMSQQIDLKAMRDTLDIAEGTLGHEDVLTNIIDAAIRLKEGNISLAKSILEQKKSEDDSLWLQIYAYCLFSEKDFATGLTYFTKAIEKIPSYEMYKILGEAAFQAGFIDKAILAFDTLVNANPEDDVTRSKLVQLYLKANDDIGAEPHLKKLWEKDKNNIAFGINYAACLARQGKTDKALDIYKCLSEMPNAPVEVVMAVASLYRVRHQPEAAFKFLDTYKNKFWNAPSFLMGYLDLGYASGNEPAGNEAMSQIRKLQQEGNAPPEILQSKTIDDLLEHNKAWRKRTEFICQNTVQGKMPWIMADNLSNHPIYMGWAIRTQALRFLADDIESRAKFNIYATNAFHKTHGQKNLNSLPIPKKLSEIVLDLSSLITLHRLGLVESINSFFSKVYVSSRYIGFLVNDTTRLEFSQISRTNSIRRIKSELDNGNIRVFTCERDSISYPLLNEYSLETDPKHYYRLVDLQATLKLTKEQMAKFRSVCCKPSGIDEGHKALKRGDKIIIDYHTLLTLTDTEILTAIESVFQLQVTAEDKQILESDVKTISWQEDLQKWNDNLIEILSQFETLAPNFLNEKDEQDICFDSYHLAKNRNINLMVDDRVVQAIALNDEAFHGDVFSIDCLLKALERDKFLETDKATDSFLQLIKWRYRFILPTVDVLLNLVKRYASEEPNNSIMIIARYVHDCMRDVGLFSGLENTDPPITICVKLYYAWMDIAMSVVVALWKDKEISSEVASSISRWVAKEFLPSAPKSMMLQCIAMANIAPSLMFEKAISQLGCISDSDRAKHAITELRKAFDLSDEAFYRMFTDLLDMTGKTHV